MGVRLKRKSIIIRLLVIGVSIYIIASLIGLWKELGKSRSTLEALKIQKSQTEAEIEEYKALLSDESQKSIIEKAARERLGYVYSDKEIYIDISGK